MTTINETMENKIQLYSLATSNGKKIGIALEEMELPYEAHIINIWKGEQFSEEFTKISPNSKIPVIVDPDGPDGESISIMESGAILIYLADKTGRFLSTNARLRNKTLQWLFFQVGHIGPMFAQFGHFYRNQDKCDHSYPLERYATETRRLLGVLEKCFDENEYLVGNEYSIAERRCVQFENKYLHLRSDLSSLWCRRICRHRKHKLIHLAENFSLVSCVRGLRNIHRP